MALRQSTAAIVRYLGRWAGWFGAVLGLPVAVGGLASFWTGDYSMTERVLMLVGGIFTFALGRIVRYLSMRASLAR